MIDPLGQGTRDYMRRCAVAAADGIWGVMNDGGNTGNPWTAFGEAAPGLTIGTNANTEPIGRLSGYMMDVRANAAHICNCSPYVIIALLDALERAENRT